MTINPEHSELSDLNRRVSSLESKFWVRVGAAVILAVWLGVTDFKSIPDAVHNELESSAAKTAENELTVLLEKAKAKEANISKVNGDGAITISGLCFNPHTMYRCGWDNSGNKDKKDDITWLENQGECNKDGYKVEGTKIILAQCD
jgi:hypothetical protein